MPTYQYACTACGHKFEAVQSFSDASLTDCPECAGRLRKVFSSVGIVFKGSGFYRTDSRCERERRAAEKSEKKPADAGLVRERRRLRRKKEPAKSDSGATTSGSSGSARPAAPPPPPRPDARSGTRRSAGPVR